MIRTLNPFIVPQEKNEVEVSGIKHIKQLKISFLEIYLIC